MVTCFIYLCLDIKIHDKSQMNKKKKNERETKTEKNMKIII